jgi:hypothetical protein
MTTKHLENIMINAQTNLKSIIKYLETLQHLYGKTLEEVPQEDKTFFDKVLLKIKHKMEEDSDR